MIALLLLLAATAQAAVLRVGLGGTASGYDYGSISAAVAAARAGDTVTIAEGNYTVATGERYPMHLKDGLSIIGAKKPGRTVIFGDLNASIFIAREVTQTATLQNLGMKRGGGTTQTSPGAYELTVGGAILADRSKMRIVECAFSEFYGVSKGKRPIGYTVYATDNAELEIIGSHFYLNSCSTDAKNPAQATLIFINISKIQISDCDFYENGIHEPNPDYRLMPLMWAYENSDLHIDRCKIYNNSLSSGLVYVAGLSTATIRESVIQNNRLYATEKFRESHGNSFCTVLSGHLIIESSQFLDNEDTFIDSVHSWGNRPFHQEGMTTIRNCVIARNKTTRGLFYTMNPSAIWIDRCSFLDNVCQPDPSSPFYETYVGGVFSHSGDVHVSNSLFVGNKAPKGAILNWGPTCLDESGFQLSVRQRGHFTNCTFIGHHNTSSLFQVSCGTYLSFQNSIGWENSAPLFAGGFRFISADRCLFDENIPLLNHTEPLRGDPAFVAPAAGDYRLRADSVCRDVGRPRLATTHDILGNKRDSKPDVGAYEYVPSPTTAERFTPPEGRMGTILVWNLPRSFPTGPGFYHELMIYAPGAEWFTIHLGYVQTGQVHFEDWPNRMFPTHIRYLPPHTLTPLNNSFNTKVPVLTEFERLDHEVFRAEYYVDDWQFRWVLPSRPGDGLFIVQAWKDGWGGNTWPFLTVWE